MRLGVRCVGSVRRISTPIGRVVSVMGFGRIIEDAALLLVVKQVEAEEEA
jgi:hypothetical protein